MKLIVAYEDYRDGSELKFVPIVLPDSEYADSYYGDLAEVAEESLNFMVEHSSFNFLCVIKPSQLSGVITKLQESEESIKAVMQEVAVDHGLDPDDAEKFGFDASKFYDEEDEEDE